MRCTVFALGVLLSALLSTVALAQDDLAARQRAALKDIREAAGDICYTVEQKGKQSESEIAGKVQAKLNGVIAKVVDLGLEGTGRLKSSEYQGVLQSDLSATLKESANCRKDVFDKLVERMLPTASSAPSGVNQTTTAPNSPNINRNEGNINIKIHEQGR